VVGATRDPLSGATTYGGLRRISKWRRMAFTLVAPGDAPLECTSMNGNIVLVPRSVYTLVGNIDERFTHSMGDIDYGLRLRAKGCRILLAPDHAGSCAKNSSAGTYRDRNLSRGERLRRAVSTKGLPPLEWISLCRRHGGPLWPVLAVSPFVRMTVQRPGRAATGAGGARKGWKVR
jgi:GT2 family glycosyltransferase